MPEGRIRKAEPNASGLLVEALAEITRLPNFRGVISAEDAGLLMKKLGITLPQLMLQLTSAASEYTVAPISNYRVGAIACGLSGNLYYGANMEFSGRPLSLCTHAEQAATINAWINGEQGLTSLAVSAAPCGYCRQFLYETSSAAKLSVILPDQTLPLSALLPLPFGPGDLGVTAALLSPQSHGLSLTRPSTSVAVQGALAAANMSYAPYTKSFAGIGIATADNVVCGAPYAENAAYNPSISPLEAALAMLNLWGYSPSAITEVALVQVQNAKVTQDAVTAAVLEVIGSPAFTVAYAKVSANTNA
jgi:cytidine deaminase